jgi:hypothetical protein
VFDDVVVAAEKPTNRVPGLGDELLAGIEWDVDAVVTGEVELPRLFAGVRNVSENVEFVRSGQLLDRRLRLFFFLGKSRIHEVFLKVGLQSIHKFLYFFSPVRLSRR